MFILSAQGIVRLLRQSDAQLFAGWGDHDSISDPKMLRKIDALADKAAGLLQASGNHIRGCMVSWGGRDISPLTEIILHRKGNLSLRSHHPTS